MVAMNEQDNFTSFLSKCHEKRVMSSNNSYSQVQTKKYIYNKYKKLTWGALPGDALCPGLPYAQNGFTIVRSQLIPHSDKK